VIFGDAENCLYAMEAAPYGAADWKTLLLRGDARSSTVAAAARILGAQIIASWKEPRWQLEFGDQTCFDQLRLDPYYRFTASRHPDLADYFIDRIEACRRQACAMVHGDYSPKNFLVHGDCVTVIDFEVVHYGDPSFDAAFLLNHLLLKCIHRPEWADRYREAAASFWSVLTAALPPRLDWFEASTIGHLGCLHLARVDGKSPAEYITDETTKERVRVIARSLIEDPPSTVAQAFERVACP
jgi:5-methylthioribose kinase